MMAGFKTFWHDLTRGSEASRTYRVAFAAPFKSSTVEYYANQVAGYVQLFTSGRLQPTFFYNLLDREAQTQFIANLQVFPYDAVVCIGSPVSKFLLRAFSESEGLWIPTLSIAYREMNGENSLPCVKENSAPDHSLAQFRLLTQLPTYRRHLLFCASEEALACVPANKNLIALLRKSGIEVSTIVVGGKKPLAELVKEKGHLADMLFLSNELVVEHAVEELVALAQQHDLLTVSARIAHMVYGIDCAIGYSEEYVCRRAGEVVACMVQGKPVHAEIFSNIPLEFHVNPVKFCQHKSVLGKVGELLGDQEVRVRLYTEAKQVSV